MSDKDNDTTDGRLATFGDLLEAAGQGRVVHDEVQIFEDSFPSMPGEVIWTDEPPPHPLEADWNKIWRQATNG